MNCICLIVTYGDRFNLIKKVSEQVIKIGVNRVIIVENGCAKKSSDKLQNYQNESRGKVKVLKQKENLGSAGGFGKGIEFIQNNYKEADFIWILDDDNMPGDATLSVLIKTHDILSCMLPNRGIVQYCYRGDTREPDRDAVTLGAIKGYKKNNFCGFNTLQFLFDRKKRKNNKEINYPIVRVLHGPYGGLFIPTGLLIDIGLPDKRFYLYGDDHEFTGRLNNYEADQFLNYGATITDIDESFGAEGYWGQNISDSKLYHSIRNHTYLSQKTRENNLNYYFNKCLFLTRQLRQGCRTFTTNREIFFHKLNIMMKAIKDGEAGNLNKGDIGEINNQ